MNDCLILMGGVSDFLRGRVGEGDLFLMGFGFFDLSLGVDLEERCLDFDLCFERPMGLGNSECFSNWVYHYLSSKRK